MIEKIKTIEAKDLDLKVIKTYKAPNITYYAACDKNKSAYLFRTLDKKESDLDFRGRIYFGYDKKDKISLVLLETSIDYKSLSKKAEKYSNTLISAKKKPNNGRFFRLLRK